MCFLELFKKKITTGTNACITNAFFTSSLCRHSLLRCMTCVLLSPSTSPGEAVARNATTANHFTTNSCGLHRLEPHVSQERKSAHAHAGTSLNSSSIDPLRSLLTPQAWALRHKSNTTSLVPVPAPMRVWPALNSAVLALFAIVPGARFSAGERCVHVPALNRAQYCKWY